MRTCFLFFTKSGSWVQIQVSCSTLLIHGTMQILFDVVVFSTIDGVVFSYTSIDGVGFSYPALT